MYKRSNLKFVKPVNKYRFKNFDVYSGKALEMFMSRCERLKISVEPIK